MLHGVEEGKELGRRGERKEQLRILVGPMINVRRNDLISKNIENFNSNELMRIGFQVFIYISSNCATVDTNYTGYWRQDTTRRHPRV